MTKRQIAYHTVTHDDFVMADPETSPEAPTTLQVTRDELGKIVMALELRAAFWETEARFGANGARTIAIEYRDLAGRLSAILQAGGRKS